MEFIKEQTETHFKTSNIKYSSTDTKPEKQYNTNKSFKLH